MYRVCPECNKNNVKIKLLTYTSRMYCEECFSQYQYTKASKMILWIFSGFTTALAISLGLFTKSIIVFGCVLILFPFVFELIFAKFCPLKLVGLRGLRKKLKNKMAYK
ncbi:MAG TPA: hypothetical protein PK055_00625 [Gammaproteobacteria bacterium]|nr:hypothetical protein [Gammaproteobacteria bacterium]HPI94692.1 hypothetical protein [Gammaproteobacteria bacterium]HPQ86137.1 hypothetical protein [Gammaproteobacteria bacterium]